ncbi:MAG: 3-phosphoshikimate 1-carboxyvinyltransferase [Agathobacter sp.]|nr:3-phosphoshikimate 1-carboxyvinyltransferase [Agathobacter sp.]
MLTQEYHVKKVQQPRPITVSVPGSKSITNRALLIAALAEGKSTLTGVLFSDDSRYFLQALCDLGFDVAIDEDSCTVSVTGCGGKLPNKSKSGSIYVGSAGTAARFLSAYLGMSEGSFYLDASEQMRKRPMKELLIALEEIGATVTFEGEAYHFPFTIGCKKRQKHEVTIDVDKSSQFLSALLIVSVLFEENFTIHVTGKHGMAYVDMTVAMMKQFGVRILKPDAGTFVIPAGQRYIARDYAVEPDLSAACYFYAMSPLLGVSAKVFGVHRNCLQGDEQFLDVLCDMGCTITEKEDGVVVLPPPDGRMHGKKWNLSEFSDQALTLAAIAPFADAPVTIEHIGHIRLQECDRMSAILTNLAAMGVRCESTKDSVTIYPEKPHAATIQTFDDHRVAMAFTLPGLLTGGIVIENPSCCRKTFEHYFDVVDAALY